MKGFYINLLIHIVRKYKYAHYTCSLSGTLFPSREFRFGTWPNQVVTRVLEWIMVMTRGTIVYLKKYSPAITYKQPLKVSSSMCVLFPFPHLSVRDRIHDECWCDSLLDKDHSTFRYCNHSISPRSMVWVEGRFRLRHAFALYIFAADTPLSAIQAVVILCIEWHQTEKYITCPAFKYACTITFFTQWTHMLLGSWAPSWWFTKQANS